MKEGALKINMQLKCKINEIEYNIVKGNTFSDEYNETLDSSSLVISHVSKIKNIKPYDDIFIYDNEFNGYPYNPYQVKKIYFNNVETIDENWITTEFDENNESYISIYVLKDDLMSYIENVKLGSEVKINMKENNSEIEYSINFIFNYMSSYFYLSPVDEKWKEISSSLIFYEELKNGKQYYCYKKKKSDLKLIPISIISFDLYFKNIEVENNNKFYKHFLVDQFVAEKINLQKNIYTYKIQLFSETKGLEIVQLPNISITQPLKYEKKKSVWEYLNQFVDMYSPKIKIADNNGKWNYKNKYSVSYELKEIFDSVYSPDFTLNNPNLRDVLSKLMIVKDMIPYVRDGVIYAMDITKKNNKINENDKDINYINESLSSDNYCDGLKRTYSEALSQNGTCHRVETLVFRNKDNALMTLGNMRLETSFPIYKINKLYLHYFKSVKITYDDDSYAYKTLLVKHNITPVVKLDYEVGWLNPRWDEMLKNQPKNLEELSKYQYGVVTYSMGSKYIDGWGRKYTYLPGINDGNILLSWWTKEATYLENILKILKISNEFGEETYDYLFPNDKNVVRIETDDDGTGETETDLSSIPDYGGSNPSNMKGFFFTIDYTGFYSGTVIHSKDNSYDNIFINDNSSSSLTLLESDGIYQKEKINRFGNKAYTIIARHQNIDNVYNLGDYFSNEEGESIIVYHREISIEDKFINAKYYAMNDYVLKNYFTSVYAKHRTYNLMSYSESIKRAENRKIFLLFSKDKNYFEKGIKWFDSFEGDFLEKLLSFMKPTIIDKTYKNFDFSNQINSAYILINNKKYLLDINSFICGNSICFNSVMNDNASGGVYIDVRNPIFGEYDENNKNQFENDYTGSLQEHYLIVDDEETGFIDKIGFYFSNLNINDELKERFKNSSFDAQTEVPSIYRGLIDALPLYESRFYGNEKNIIGSEIEIKKDNKELIDMTFQIEPFSNDNDIVFSHWMMSLSDLIINEGKSNETKLMNGSLMRNGTIKYGGFFMEKMEAASVSSIVLVIKIKKDEIQKMYESSNNGENDLFIDNAEIILNNSRLAILTEKIKKVKIKFNKFKINKNDDNSFSIILPSNEKIITYRWAIDTYQDYPVNDFEELEFKNVNNYNEYNNESVLDNLDFSDQEDYNEYDYFIAEIRKLTFSEGEFDANDLHFNESINYNSNISKFNNIPEAYLNIEADYSTNSPLERNFKAVKNLFLILDNQKIDSSIIYVEKNKKEVLDYGYYPENIFKVENNILKIDLTDISSDTKSIQQWYLSNGSLKFVFGVNITEEDIERGYINIYLSLIQNRDNRVYDEMHNIVGYVTNYNNSIKNWGENQYYDKIYKIEYKYVQYLGIINGEANYEEIKKSDYKEIAEGQKIIPSLLDAPEIDGYGVTSVSPIKEIIIDSDITITYTYQKKAQ